ncbi:MAG TPA: S-methyl-5'-thioadenosine phosphorylase [Tepidisphaeraceae bacterium]|jgi:5'-methylthioadenosine phosphorylase
MSQIKVGIIGGSGLGQILPGDGGRRHAIQTPFGSPSDAIIETDIEGLPVLLLNRHGPGHLIPPTSIPFRANIFTLKQLGCTHIIASGACGSLRQEFKPRDLIIPDQIIDKTTSRAATFFEKAAVHVEFAEPFCPILRRILIEQGANKTDPTVHDRGCYVCMEGPAFSTRAESLMHRLWGGDLIGMTAMPEAKLAREAEIPYALIGIVTDYDSWKSQAPTTPGAPPPTKTEALDPAALLQEIIGNLQSASAAAMELIRKTLRQIAADPARLSACPAQNALKLAIWSEKSRIPREEIERLSPLWAKYFG